MVFWSIAIVTAMLALASAMALARSRVWWVRFFDFPRLQLTVVAGILLFLQLSLLDLGSGWTWSMIVSTVVCLAYQGWWILPYLPFFRREVRDSNNSDPASRLTVFNVNVQMENRKVDALLRMIRAKAPDIVAVAEADDWWQSQLEALEADYPYPLKCPMDNRHGILLFSRLPLVDSRIQYLVEPKIPSMHTLVTLPSGDQVQLHCIHPQPPAPIGNETSAERDAELVVVGKAAAKSEYPVVIVGDINDVPWSVTTRVFHKVSGMLDPRVGRGLFNTFHTRYPFMRWPLDHLFHSSHFTLVRLERLASFGSDHFPLLVELALQPRRGAGQEVPRSRPVDRERARRKAEAKGVSEDDVTRPGE